MTFGIPRFSFDKGLTIGTWIGLPLGRLGIDLVEDGWPVFLRNDLLRDLVICSVIGLACMAWSRRHSLAPRVFGKRDRRLRRLG